MDRTWRRGERCDVPASGPPPTLAGFHAAQRLDISCCYAGCYHRTLWTRDEAIARLGPTCTMVEAERRLKCAMCKRDLGIKVAPYSVDRDDIRYGQPYASWPDWMKP